MLFAEPRLNARCVLEVRGNRRTYAREQYAKIGILDGGQQERIERHEELRVVSDLVLDVGAVEPSP